MINAPASGHTRIVVLRIPGPHADTSGLIGFCNRCFILFLKSNAWRVQQWAWRIGFKQST